VSCAPHPRPYPVPPNSLAAGAGKCRHQFGLPGDFGVGSPSPSPPAPGSHAPGERLRSSGRASRHTACRRADRPSMSPCRPIKHCGRRIQINGFSTPNPSHRQAVPGSFALCGTREFGHSPTFGGKPPEFLTAVH
jgi:hypothetical protein